MEPPRYHYLSLSSLCLGDSTIERYRLQLHLLSHGRGMSKLPYELGFPSDQQESILVRQALSKPQCSVLAPMSMKFIGIQQLQSVGIGQPGGGGEG